MSVQAKTQIQVRIDSKTKRETKRILDDLGMDISTAVKMLFKQISRTGSFPLEIRDVNGFRPHKARELRESIAEAERSKKTFSSVVSLIKNVQA